MQRVLGAAVIMLVGVSVVTAEEFFAAIIKVEGNKVTVSKRKKSDEKPGEPMTLTAADNVKVVKAKFNKETMKLEAGDPLEGGLKNERFAKETRGVIITNAENVITEIRVADPFRKKKDDK